MLGIRPIGSRIKQQVSQSTIDHTFGDHKMGIALQKVANLRMPSWVTGHNPWILWTGGQGWRQDPVRQEAWGQTGRAKCRPVREDEHRSPVSWEAWRYSLHRIALSLDRAAHWQRMRLKAAWHLYYSSRDGISPSFSTNIEISFRQIERAAD